MDADTKQRPSSAPTSSPSLIRSWSRLSMRQCLFMVALCFGSVLLVALLAGKSHFRHRVSDQHFPFTEQQPEIDELREAIFSNIEPARIASTLRLVTQEPHQAGTEANRRVADRIAALWKENGIEKVHMLEYDVLLSYPNWTTPNHATVLSEQGDVIFQSTGLSPDLIPPNGVFSGIFLTILIQGGDDYRAAIQWLAYSANGTVEGEPVYCHYGRPQDFERLEKEFGISSLEGKIAVIRYGEDFRGDKVKHAEQRGAAAAILFSDPVEVAGDGPDEVFPRTDYLPPSGVQRGTVMEWNGDPLTPLLPARHDFHREKTIEQHTFPHSAWMPPKGVQRGSIMDLKGDPLTPLLPARRDFARGRTIEQAKQEGIVPRIPVLPLGFADAAHILSRMGGPKVPDDWQGGLKFPYHVGPGFASGKGSKLRVDVFAQLKIKTIQNVVGIIRGREEPDSWVMLGNHYDAWVFGSLDPNSGTAILGEVGRAFADAVRTKGWRPKRTLVFCAWDAEEHGLIGSTEFVQEFADVLRERAVVYLNLDLISSNQSLDVRTVPSLFQAVTDAAKFVKNPVKAEIAKGRPTMFDSWKAYFPPTASWLQEMPHMKLPGGGSDHMSFLNFLGIPVVDFTYRNASWASYPLYHSRYEVPFVNEHLFDCDNLAVHKGIGEYWAELARAFADSPVLPINATLFGQQLLKDYLAHARQAIFDLYAKYPAEVAPALQQMGSLERQTQAFLAQSHNFGTHMQMAEPGWANRRLRKLDQCFINPAMGLARKEPEKRHVLFSLSDDDTYSASVMTAVNQKIGELAKEGDPTKRAELGRQLALELTVVQNAVLCATNMLKPFI